MKKKSILFIIKGVVSISLLSFIILNINWDEVVKNLRAANYLLLIIVFALNIIERAELTYKWNLLIWVRGINVSFGRLFLINAIGGFWGLFLPSSLGTDVVRGYYLIKNNSARSVSVSSIFVDRILGIFSLLLLVTISLLLTGDLIPETSIKIYVFILFIAIILFFYFFQKDETAKLLKKILAKIKYKKITEIISKLHFSILEYKKYPKTLLLSFLITLLVQMTRVLTYFCIALAFNISVPIVYFFLFIPIIMLVIMLPVSIGGFGVREGTFIAFFTLVGMSINNAVIISFTNSFVNTLITLLGGIVYLFYRSPEKPFNQNTGEKIILFNNSTLKSEETK
ncbi:MAG TPA: lysylphosphatidylglycerol synthase transmembrane domain-containing protein [Ignavibacteriaceae bacterium]|nr:lysylphosphatidylglycerol synthase transmembrane domain-containing protein [Ignavibacteriaceae bacterium]